jgi:hypothetical protein
VLARYELGLDELELLEELGRSLDLADVLEEAIQAKPVFADGSVAPAVRELRQLRAEIRHLTAALALPDPVGDVVSSGRAVAASKAANQRWKREKENHG